MLEADLAFRGLDLRDLWRRGSGMTPRRLSVLIAALPGESAYWTAIAIEEQKALKPTPDQIRAAGEKYRR